MFRKLLAAGLVLLLAGCGYQLRGAFALPDSMTRTYVAAADQHSIFYEQLLAALRANGVELVDSPMDAGAVMYVHVDDTGQRVLSVSARNVPREYEVHYTVQFSVEDTERVLLEPQVLTLTRDYTYDETQVLGKAREEEILRRAIADDLVRLVLRRLSSI